MTDEYPPGPLLEPANVRVGWSRAEIMPFYGPAYTADQMRAYRNAEVAEVLAKEREKLAQIVAPESILFTDQEWRIRCEVADAIRDIARG